MSSEQNQKMDATDAAAVKKQPLHNELKTAEDDLEKNLVAERHQPITMPSSVFRGVFAPALKNPTTPENLHLVAKYVEYVDGPMNELILTDIDGNVENVVPPIIDSGTVRSSDISKVNIAKAGTIFQRKLNANAVDAENYLQSVASGLSKRIEGNATSKQNEMRDILNFYTSDAEEESSVEENSDVGVDDLEWK